MEHIGQRTERAGAALGSGCDALGLLARIFMGKFDQTHIIAALRHADKDLFVQFLLQKSREQLRVLQLKRRKNDLGRCAARKIELLDEGGDGLLRVVRRGKDLIFLVEQASAYIMQDCEAGPRFVLVIADHVGIGHRPGGHKLLFAEGFDGAQPVAQGRGKLKL